MGRLQNKTNGLKSLMRDNIREMVANTEKLDELESEAQQLEKTAEGYKERTREVRQYYWWKDIRITMLIGCVVLLLVVGLVSYIVSFFSKDDKTPQTARLLIGNGVDDVTDVKSY